MSSLTAFNLFIRQCLLYPLASPFLPAPADVRKDLSYANGSKIGTLVGGGLPRTGQITPVADYDDGYYQAGNPIVPRFIDNGNGTITDRGTNKQWVKQPELIIPGATGVHSSNQIQVYQGYWYNETTYAKADAVRESDGTYWICAVAHTSAAEPTTFAEDRTAHPTYWRETIWIENGNWPNKTMFTFAGGLAACEGLEYAGHTDWRLPNIIELLSLYNFGKSSEPAIYEDYFPEGGGVWLSSTAAGDNFGMDVLLLQYKQIGYGGVIITSGGLSTTKYVRPIRD